MKTKTTVFALFVTFFLGTIASAGQIDPRKALATQALLDMKNPEKSKKLYEILFKDVVTEIEAEAAAAGLDRDKYIDGDASFDRFVANLRASHLDGLEKPELLIAVIKAGIRFQIQSKVRLVSDKHIENMKAVPEIMAPYQNKLMK